MAKPRTPRDRWIEEGLDALAAGGPDAVRVEVLAKALGVTKGGFYGYFAGREQLLAEVLDAWERVAIDDVIADIDARGGDARERLWRLFTLAGADDARVLQIDLAVRDWARRDESVAKRLQRADDRRMRFLRDHFAQFAPDPDVRALVAFSLWIGPHFIAARGKRAPLKQAFRDLLA